MGIDLLSDKSIIEKAKAEWTKARGEGFKYIPLIGNRTPALYYRD
jgi:aminobenzoyl-glutamate utilization protein B